MMFSRLCCRRYAGMRTTGWHTPIPGSAYRHEKQRQVATTKRTKENRTTRKESTSSDKTTILTALATKRSSKRGLPTSVWPRREARFVQWTKRASPPGPSHIQKAMRASWVPQINPAILGTRRLRVGIYIYMHMYICGIHVYIYIYIYITCIYIYIFIS